MFKKKLYYVGHFFRKCTMEHLSTLLQDTKCHSQWTFMSQVSSKTLSVSWGLSPLHDKFLKLSSMSGLMLKLLIVRLSSSAVLSVILVVNFSPSSHHDIWAGGLAPRATHTMSVSLPADRGWYGLVMRTSVGLTERKKYGFGMDCFQSLIVQSILVKPSLG